MSGVPVKRDGNGLLQALICEVRKWVPPGHTREAAAKAFARFAAVYPAVCVLIALLTGMFAVATPGTAGLSVWFFFVLLVPFVGMLILASPRVRWLLTGFVLLGMVVMARQRISGWKLQSDCVDRPWTRAAIRGIALDAPIPPEVSVGTTSPTGIRVAVCEVRTALTSEWQPCHGRTLMLPGIHALPLPYGSLVQAEGVFCPPSPAPFPGGFDYARYLQTLGIGSVFRIDTEPRILRAHAVGIRVIPAAIFQARDWCARKLVGRIEPASNRALLLGMVFGMRGCLETSARDRYLRSGAIHIFAVSGLHVGIVSAVLALFLRAAGVPFRPRFAVMPVLLAGYVLMTGCSPSAVRAWLMITVWCLSRALLLPPVPVNTVAFAASLLLLANPGNLYRTGFQFTFIIVGVLILGWPMVSRWASSLQEKRLWIPRSEVSLTSFIYGEAQWRLARLLGASLFAWLGSVMLVARTNGLIVPSALITNIGLGLVASGVLTLSFPKILFAASGLVLPDMICARVMEMLTTCADVITSLGAAAPGSLPVPRPGIVICLVYYLALGIFLCRGPRNPRLGRVCLGLVSVLIFLVVARGIQPPGTSCTVLSGGEAVEPLLVLERSEGNPVVVNSGPAAAAAVMVQWLKFKAYDGVDTLVLTGTSWGEASGATRLIEDLPVRTLFVPEEKDTSPHLASAVRAQLQQGGRVRYIARPSDQPACLSAAIDETVRITHTSEDHLGRTTRVNVLSPAENTTVSLSIGDFGDSALEVRRGNDSSRQVFYRQNHLALIVP